MSQLILRINNIFTDIVGDLTHEHKIGLQKRLSFRPEGYQFAPSYNRFIRDKKGNIIRRAWDGWQKQFWSNTKKTYFPTGLFSLVSEYLKTHNIDYRIENFRVVPERNNIISNSGAYVYRTYQSSIIDLACEKQRGLIRCPTGSGKTVIGAGIIEKLKVAPFMFFVTSTDLLKQAKESFEEALLWNGYPLKVGQIGDGVIDIRDINVCTVQSAVRALGEKWDSKARFDSEDENEDKTPIEKHRKEICELFENTKGVICDECQHWKAETCQLVCRSLKSAYYTFGLSATPTRDSGDDMLIQACFGKFIASISASELIEKGWLVRPDIKIVHIKDRKSQFKQWQAIYKDRIVDCEKYNGIVANIANSFIDNGRLVLILSQQISHGKKIAEMVKGASYLSGNSSKKQREEGLNNLRNGYIKCLSSSTIFDEGVDVRPLDCVILAGGGKSKTRAMQRIGRITRPYTSPDGKEKKDAIAVDFRIYDEYLKKHSEEREKMYRTEPAYRIEHIND